MLLLIMLLERVTAVIGGFDTLDMSAETQSSHKILNSNFQI